MVIQTIAPDLEYPKLRQKFVVEALAYNEALKGTEDGPHWFTIQPGTDEWNAWVLYLFVRFEHSHSRVQQWFQNYLDGVTPSICVPDQFPEVFDPAYREPEDIAVRLKFGTRAVPQAPSEKIIEGFADLKAELREKFNERGLAPLPKSRLGRNGETIVLITESPIVPTEGRGNIGSTSAADRKAAQQKLREWERDIAAGEYPVSSDIAVSDELTKLVKRRHGYDEAAE